VGRPEQLDDPGPAEGILEAEGKNIYIRSPDGRLRLIDIEIAHNRLKGQEIFNYFKGKKGMILK